MNEFPEILSDQKIYSFQKILIIPVLLILILSEYSFSQESDSINYNELSNKIFKSNIKTVLLHRDGWDLSPPLMKFNQGEKLKLSFDDLDADGKEYSYTIVHCDAFWKPTQIEKYKYIDGYEEDYIYDFTYSANTIISYTHHELVFPTEDLKPKIPGNYILKVYYEEEDSIYFTRRFMVLETKVSVEGTVKQASLLEDRNYKQEVDFSILSPTYNIVNPYRDLKVIILQNGRWDNALTELKPKMVIDGKLDYNYDFENVFDGGNEFRTTDITSLAYYTANIEQIKYTVEGYQINLRADEKRTFKNYRSIDDINGMYKIKTDEHDENEIRSEYVFVHFRLHYDTPLLDAEIFINGALTDWNLDENSKLVYDYQKTSYVRTLVLKQGYYNYQYVMKYMNSTKGDVSFIEGNHWETRNEYTILVYNKEFGNEYDSLIGLVHINSYEE